MEISNGLKYGTIAATGIGATAALVGATNSLSNQQQNNIADTIGAIGIAAGAIGGGKMLYNHLHVKEEAQEARPAAPHNETHGTGGDGAVPPEDHAATPGDVHTHLDEVAQEHTPPAPHDGNPGDGAVPPEDHAATPGDLHTHLDDVAQEHTPPAPHDGNPGTGGDGVPATVTRDSQGTNERGTETGANRQETSATQPNTTTWGDRVSQAVGYDSTRSWGDFFTT